MSGVFVGFIGFLGACAVVYGCLQCLTPRGGSDAGHGHGSHGGHH